MDFRFATVDDAELLAQLRVAMRAERETLPPPADEKAFLKANIDYFRSALSDGSYVGIIAEEAGSPAANGGICFHIHPPVTVSPTAKAPVCSICTPVLTSGAEGWRGRSLKNWWSTPGKRSAAKSF